MTLSQLKSRLKQLGNKNQAKLLQRFFKTGPGDYGEGDIFLGIKVPVQRATAKKYYDLSLKDIQSLLNSEIHEYRMVALFILAHQYKEGDNQKKNEIFNLYLNNTSNINNWDLIDLSSPNIVGNYLLDKDRKLLYKLASSHLLWERRISVLATFMFIKHNDFHDSLKIAEILLNDSHDLIHKAIGWMLREIGKKDQSVEEGFLKKHYKTMPRTMLRYSIERFSQSKKDFFMGRK